MEWGRGKEPRPMIREEIRSEEEGGLIFYYWTGNIGLPAQSPKLRAREVDERERGRSQLPGNPQKPCRFSIGVNWESGNIPARVKRKKRNPAETHLLSPPLLENIKT